MNAKDKLVAETVLNCKPYDNVLLQYATGCGKTLCSLKIAKDKEYKKILILCDELLNINTWEDEIKKWSIDIDYDIMCYQSLHKVEDKYDCVILDECDVITEKRFDHLIKLNTHFIFLSAKVERDKMNILKSLCKFKTFTIRLTDAINKGILPKPSIKIVNINFDDTKKYVYTKGAKANKTVECSYQERFNHFSKNTHVKVHCTESQYYKLLTDDIEYLKKEIRFDQTLKLPLNKKGLDRKNFISDVKVRWLKENIKLFENKRYICFLNRIQDCDHFSIHESVHYQTTNDNVINDFNDLKINRLFAINKLDRGKNLKNVELGIIAVLNKKSTIKFIQEIGRVLRSEKPLIYLLIVNSTYEKDVLNEIYQDVDKIFFNNF